MVARTWAWRWRSAGFSPWVTLAGAMLAAAVLGVLVERRRVSPGAQPRSHVTPLITTIAVGLVLQQRGGEDLRRRAGGFSSPLRIGIPLLGPGDAHDAPAAHPRQPPWR